MARETEESRLGGERNRMGERHCNQGLEDCKVGHMSMNGREENETLGIPLALADLVEITTSESSGHCNHCFLVLQKGTLLYRDTGSRW